MTLRAVLSRRSDQVENCGSIQSTGTTTKSTLGLPSTRLFDMSHAKLYRLHYLDGTNVYDLSGRLLVSCECVEDARRWIRGRMLLIRKSISLSREVSQ